MTASDRDGGTSPAMDELRRAGGPTRVKESAVQAVVDGTLGDPHAVLGAHPVEHGVVIRAFRPDAVAITALVDGAGTKLEQIHPAGVFEGEVEGATLPLAYELEVSYADGGTYTLRDPYGFAPTLGELDIHLAGEGRHEEIYEHLGAHVKTVDGISGTAFAVWAPAAASVAVVGTFNSWDGRLHRMRTLGSSGIWELFVPDVGDGAVYKFEIRTGSGKIVLKADPYAFETQHPPETSSVVHTPKHQWRDQAWMQARKDIPLDQPISVYEVHLGSWRRSPDHPDEPLDYATLARDLAAYVKDMGFTHVELLPVMGHPYAPSWGYQVTSYFAPTPRYGSPDDLRGLVDHLHGEGIGVILDWVPAHFPKDAWALANFDGSALYEHADPRRGSHPDWGTLVFNSGRNEVKNFLLASALYWCREFHADGIRVDAVASMLYLDYSREEGQWVPNEFGGNEDLEAVALLKELKEVLHAREPGIISAAEESTSWPGVSKPVYLGGLGFGFKWNMGWMNDTLRYFAQDPIHRRYHHHELTFSLVYAFSENFMLPLSHDEVVHGKGSIVEKMPGDRWQKLANVRALYAFMWSHPGKKLLFQGLEWGQSREWTEQRSLDWHELSDPGHAGVQAAVRELNHVYQATPALWEVDFDGAGFTWLEANDSEANVVVYARFGKNRDDDALVCALNLSATPRPGYRIGLPQGGGWKKVLDTDEQRFGGSGFSEHQKTVAAEHRDWHGQEFSAPVDLPPLGVVWLVPDR